jgi:hypothetical protein
MFRQVSLVAMLIAVGGCSGEKRPAPARHDMPAKAAATAPTTLAPTATPKASAAISVDGEGLRIFAEPGGSARAIPFGTDESAVIAMVEKLRGPAKRDSNDECGAGPVQFAHFGGLSLLFQEGKFGGWSLSDAEAGGIGTTNGIGVASTRAALDAAFATNKIDPDSTLGTEFYTAGDGEGGISGLLDGAGSQAKVTDLWAGVSCVFR